jgi:hypothetical protein
VQHGAPMEKITRATLERLGRQAVRRANHTPFGLGSREHLEEFLHGKAVWINTA